MTALPIRLQQAIDPASETFNYTDLGNAKRLVDENRGIVRYVSAWRKWLVWNPPRWRVDEDGEISRLAKSAILSMYQRATALGDTERKHLIDWARKSESAARLRDMVSLASTEEGVPIRADKLDADPYLLGTKHVVIDLKTGEPKSHRPGDFVTKSTGVEYDPKATCPIWALFLDTIMGGDDELIGFLRRVIGYTLTGDTSEQCIFILHGTGANGKSTFIATVKALLGEYAKCTQFSTVLAKRDGGIPCDIADLCGARFVAAVESDCGRRLAEGLVKQLSGGDPVVARRLYSDPFEYTPQFKLALASNHKPTIAGTDLAIWRRIRLIPFEVTIPPGAQDKHLVDKLRRELPGILNWAIAGCLDWQEHGLCPPSAVTAATATYRSDMDRLADFIEDVCTIGDDVRASTGELQKAYREWCERAGEHPLKGNRFVEAIEERGFRRTERLGKGRRYWLGVGILEQGLQP